MLPPKHSPTIDVLDATQPFSISSLALPLGAMIRGVGVPSAPTVFHLRAGAA